MTERNFVGGLLPLHQSRQAARSPSIFRTPEGAEPSCAKLIGTADVVIENFKLGAGLKKYGLDFEGLKAINPRLIYCSITGFGQSGPYAPRAGYDFIIQGIGGLMSITGEAGGEPQKGGGWRSPTSLPGSIQVIAIQAALRHAEKTGEGQHIDMALLDTQVSILGNQRISTISSRATRPCSMGNAHMNISPYEVLPVRGWLHDPGGRQ